MSEYQLAFYFWSTVMGFGLVAPFIMVLVREARDAIEHVHRHGLDHGVPPSLTSVPLPSRPSGF
jgi:hypothetical protein